MAYELEEMIQHKWVGQLTEGHAPISAFCSYQRPEHREDAGGTHNEQPAQGLGVVVLDHLNHPQEGLHPRPPQVPHVESFQVHQAGPGAAADMGPLTTPCPATSQHPLWGAGGGPTDRDGWRGLVRQGWEQKGQGSQDTLVDPATMGRPHSEEAQSVGSKAEHPNSSVTFTPGSCVT